jgi:hypothetical protein
MTAALGLEILEVGGAAEAATELGIRRRVA